MIRLKWPLKFSPQNDETQILSMIASKKYFHDRLPDYHKQYQSYRFNNLWLQGYLRIISLPAPQYGVM